MPAAPAARGAGALAMPRETVWNPGQADLFINGLRVALARRRLLGLAARTRKECIVDVGCGLQAFFLQSLRGRFARRVGVDLALDGEALARAGIEAAPGDALGALERMEPESADVITFLSIMEHVTGQEEILAQCRRVLRKNGIVFVNSPSWFGKLVLESLIIPFWDRNGIYSAQVDTHLTYFSPASLWQCVRNAGFVSSEIRVWRSNFLCSVSACATRIF